MAHELELVNGKASFVYNSENGRPWHLLGEPVKGQGSAQEMLEKANANYQVWLEPVFVMDQRKSDPIMIDGVEYVRKDAMVGIEERNATVRHTPLTEELQPFEVFRGRYTTMQNEEVLNKALEIVNASKGDAVIDTLGVIRDGAVFFATIDLGALIIDPGGAADKIARYLMVKTSHDGSSPLVYANTDIRVVCANTVRLAEREAKAVFKARHTPKAEERIDEARKVLNLSTEWSQQFVNDAMELMAIDMPKGSGRVEKVLDQLWPEADADTDRKKDNRNEIVQSVLLRYNNQRNAGHVGFNGWAFYNSIVEYLDWGRGKEAKAMVTASLDESGFVSKKKVAAQRAILNLAN